MVATKKQKIPGTIWHNEENTRHQNYLTQHSQYEYN